MKPHLLVAALSLLLAGCGATKVVTQPPSAPPPQAAATQTAGTGNPENVYQYGRGRRHPPYHPATGCGKERWSVKVLTDPAASTVDLTPRLSSVAVLTSLAPPVNPTDRVAPTETQTYTIAGTLTLAKQEADHDYHLVIADHGQTMIVEVPDPSCATGSRVLKTLRMVRSAFVSRFGDPARGVLRPNVQVSVTGPVFFDRRHGQTGVAPNGIELHPALAISSP